MKMTNVKFYAFAEYSDGTESECMWFCSEKAMSNWANKQFIKDGGVTVRVFNFKDDTTYCTYHA